MGRRKTNLSRSSRNARATALYRARKAKKAISIEVESSQDCRAPQSKIRATSEFTYYKGRKYGKTRKKWTNEENQLLLDYLLENKDIEKPTAHLYYANFLNKTKIYAHPNMMCGKVRHLKKTYLMAEQWLRTKVNKGDIDCPIIKEKLHKICPYYNRLSQIFPINDSDTAVSYAEDDFWYNENKTAKIFGDFAENNSTLPDDRYSSSEDLMQMVKSEIVVEEAANLVKSEIIFDEEAATVIKSEIIFDEETLL
ncbi:uncharacterized protein LOC128858252 [Anastrepha ludens]|uniref:uncharacterized protein LOC128858252 n=1 Tax=Anastrepha ludens TaxID=28586 RepID=UPI0023B0A0FB|nr:uncharacterized protein LOC128858252 [Anastrepha ludens]